MPPSAIAEAFGLRQRTCFAGDRGSGERNCSSECSSRRLSGGTAETLPRKFLDPFLPYKLLIYLEATPGIEPGYTVLQTVA